MALSDRAKKIRRYFKLHAQNKVLAKELDELKDYFKTESGGEDCVFTYRNIEIPVTWKERSGYEVKPSRYQEVTCRKTEDLPKTAKAA